VRGEKLVIDDAADAVLTQTPIKWVFLRDISELKTSSGDRVPLHPKPAAPWTVTLFTYADSLMNHV